MLVSPPPRNYHLFLFSVSRMQACLEYRLGWLGESRATGDLVCDLFPQPTSAPWFSWFLTLPGAPVMESQPSALITSLLCLPVLCLYLDPSILLVSWSFGCWAGHPAFPEGLPRASTRVAGTRCWQPVSWQAQKPSLSEGTEPPPLDFLRQVQPCLSSHSVNTKFEPKCDFKVIHLEKCLS